MAYQGYLIKVGSYTIPLSLIKADSYSVFMSVTDLDSYVDANGYLHRNALEHIANKVEFETVPMLDHSQFANLMSNLRANMTIPLERKASVECYIPEIDSYVTQDMYMPDVSFPIYGTYNNVITYNSIAISFIGY